MKRYDTYKNSGVEWLGEIPKHWEIKELKHLSSSQPYSFVDGPFGSDLKNEEYVDEGIPLIQLNNIGIGEHLLKNKRFITSEKSEQLSKHKAYPGEIVIAKMAEPVARAAKVSEEFSQYNIVADCIKFKPDDKLVVSDLLVAIINSEYVRTQAELKATGTTRLRISLDTAKRLKVAVPPYKEQVALGKYIKENTRGIDKIIQQKKLLLEKLQAKRQAIINEAVTKGLNPNVPMKPSGVEWLGDIPEHWHAKQIKHIKDPSQNSFVDGPFGSNLKSEHFIEDGPVLVIESGSITKGQFIEKQFKTISQEHFETIKRSECKEGDIIISKIGANYGMSGILTDLGRQAVVSGNSMKLTVDKKRCNIEFIHFCLLFLKTSGVLKLIVNETAQPALSLGTMNNLHIPLPSLNEQNEIIVVVKKRIGVVDKLNSLLVKQIEKLKGYRQSLISEVVTGKIKVV